jgi:hypothetical protein
MYIYHFATVCPRSFHKQCILVHVRHNSRLYSMYKQQYCTLDPVCLESSNQYFSKNQFSPQPPAAQIVTQALPPVPVKTIEIQRAL